MSVPLPAWSQQIRKHPDYYAIVEGAEPSKRNFVGLVVEFDLVRTGGVVTRERGEVVAQKWLGLTKRGLIPEYELNVRGKSGRIAKARLTDDFVKVI